MLFNHFKKIISLVLRLFKLTFENILFRYFIKLPVSLLMAKRLFCDKSRTYLVICNHIGDFLITMGFLDAFKAQHHISAVTICITPKMEGIASRYLGSEDQIICLKRRKLNWLLFLNVSRFTSEWIRKQGNIWLMEPSGHFTDAYFAFMLHFPRMTLRKVIQYGCLHLPEYAPFVPLPLRPVINKEVPKKKRILLCPFVQGDWVGKVPMDLFESLITAVIHRGDYEIFTNIGSGEKSETAISGTQPLSTTLEELEQWLSPEDCVIGFRSGMMDYLAYLPCHFVCLYPYGSRHNVFYSLDMLPNTRGNYHELQLSEDTAENVRQIINEFISMY